MLRKLLAFFFALMLMIPALGEGMPSVSDCLYTPRQSTVIRYTLPQLSTISLSVYDGDTLVASIMNNRKMIAGNHALELDENFFDDSLSGSYTLLLTVDGVSYTAAFYTDGAAPVVTATPVPAPTQAPEITAQPEPTLAPTAEPAATPAVNMNAVITPAYESGKR